MKTRKWFKEDPITPYEEPRYVQPHQEDLSYHQKYYQLLQEPLCMPAREDQSLQEATVPEIPRVTRWKSRMDSQMVRVMTAGNKLSYVSSGALIIFQHLYCSFACWVIVNRTAKSNCRSYVPMSISTCDSRTVNKTETVLFKYLDTSKE